MQSSIRSCTLGGSGAGAAASTAVAASPERSPSDPVASVANSARRCVSHAAQRSNRSSRCAARRNSAAPSAPPSRYERDLAADAIDVRDAQRTEESRLGHAQHVAARAQGARLKQCLRSDERTRGSRAGVGRQLDGALEERRSGPIPPPARARSAERASSAATSSSGPEAACAWCHGRRSGSKRASVTAADAACARRRSSAEAER